MRGSLVPVRVHHRRQCRLRTPGSPLPQVWVTTNHVLALEVVLPTGEWSTWARLHSTLRLRLAGVFVGSEGTLGVASS